MALMTRANHDVRTLFTGIYVIAVVHYGMKCMAKCEVSLQSRLAMAEVIRSEMKEEFEGARFNRTLGHGINNRQT
jgi:hypothetical protein